MAPRTDEGPRPEAGGQTPNEDQSTAPDQPAPNFWDEVGKGKVRPAPCEPDITHYRDRNDGWSA